jgi:hypothetical protein
MERLYQGHLHPKLEVPKLFGTSTYEPVTVSTFKKVGILFYKRINFLGV